MAKKQPEFQRPTKEQVDMSKANLGAKTLQNYAAGIYGNEIVGKLWGHYNPYAEAPDQESWDAIYKQRMESGEAVHSPHVLRAAASILETSLKNMKISDLSKYVKNMPQNISEQLTGIYLGLLPNKIYQMIKSMYFQQLVRSRLEKEVLPLLNAQEKVMLEQMLNPRPEAGQGQNQEGSNAIPFPQRHQDEEEQEISEAA